MTPDLKQQIEDLHAVYCAETRMHIFCDMARERCWWEFIRRGFGKQELLEMIRHLQKEIRAGRRNPGALKFHNLIVNVDWFEEDLALLRAQRQVDQARSGVGQDGCIRRAEVLQASGRPAAAVTASQANTARTAGDVMAGMKALEEFRKLKETL